MRSPILLGVLSVASLACGSSTTATQQPIVYASVMNGSNEVPARATTATGTATYTLLGNTLSYVVTVSGLTGPATASHIHSGASAVSGPVIVPFTITNGTVASGQIDLSQQIVFGTSSITGDSLKVLLNNGVAYTNVHTAQFPGGEIRGQIVKQ